MKNWNKKLPKLKKGAWFVEVRGSYLPMTSQAWLLHAAMVICAAGLLVLMRQDTRSMPVVAFTFVLELIGLGTVFTYIASKKA